MANLTPLPGGVSNLSGPILSGSKPDWIKEEHHYSLPINERIEPMLLNNQKQTDTLAANNEKTASQDEDHRIDKVLDLYQKLQEEVSKTHIEYQTLTEKSHLAYLEEARTALDDIRQLAMGWQSSPLASTNAGDHDTRTIGNHNTEISPSPPQVALAQPLKTETIVVAAPVQKMELPPIIATAVAPATTVVPVVAAVTQEACIITQPIVPDQVSVDMDLSLQAAIIAIVADKTGYPEDTLSMDMDLEADLGIDSIKRVEIFSALQEKIPNLPELNLAELAGLHTFAEIAAYVKKQQGV